MCDASPKLLACTLVLTHTYFLHTSWFLFVLGWKVLVHCIAIAIELVLILNITIAYVRFYDCIRIFFIHVNHFVILTN